MIHPTMPRRNLRYATFTVLAALVTLGVAGLRAEKVTIYRDEWGIPHIYADTDAGAVFGMGYAQAEDRPEELFRQYRRAAGTMAEVFGPEFIRDDYRQRVWRHAAISRERYGEVEEHVRRLLEAFVAGVEHYFSGHPERRPAWAMTLEPWQIVALGRYIIWGWPEGTAGGDLRRGGIEPDPVEGRSSNQWLVASSKSAHDAPFALVDPHLSWYGAFRFYEARLYGGDLQISGVSVLGSPIPSLGHSRFCSVAMTTGGPDTSDIFEETLDPSRPDEYLYDGSWHKLTVRTAEIRVKEGDGIRVIKKSIRSTGHGPIVATRDDRGYAMAIPYFDEVGLTDQIYEMMTARNLAQMKTALSRLQLMEQNVMVGTVDGDIYYLRNGRVPRRPAGHDWTRPVPGHTSRTAWQGIHPLEDLVQILNPPQGYMQNCNISPAHLMKGSPLTPTRYEKFPYLFNVDMPYLHQRAAQVLKELHAVTKMTVGQAIAIANSTTVFNADLWQRRLDTAMRTHGSRLESSPDHDADARLVLELVSTWNRRSNPDSAGATAYLYWKRAVYELRDEVPEAMRLRGASTVGAVALMADRAGLEPPPVNPTALINAVTSAARSLRKDWGRVVVAWGEMHRIGRDGSSRTYPIGGGNVQGMSTPRAVGYRKRDDGKTFIGHGGQTATQVVLLTRPPRSWSLLPLGESDDPESPHFDDQAARLLPRQQMKSTYFLDREELLMHVTRQTVLEWSGN